MGLGTFMDAFPSYNFPILTMPVGDVNLLTQAIKFNIERVWQKFPNCQVIIATPSQTGNSNFDRVKEVRDLIIKCGERMSIQVIDQFGENGILGFNEINNNIYLRDKLHYTEDGAVKAALYLLQQFKMKITRLYTF